MPSVPPVSAAMMAKRRQAARKPDKKEQGKATQASEIASGKLGVDGRTTDQQDADGSGLEDLGPHIARGPGFRQGEKCRRAKRNDLGVVGNETDRGPICRKTGMQARVHADR